MGVAEIVITIGCALVIGALGYGTKTLLSHGSAIAVLKSSHAELRADVTEIKGDVKHANDSLQRLLGRQEERNGHQ
jgi:hypothetical protein